MDQGLGLKNTHPVDDLASSSDVRIAKDNSGPVYEAKETEEAVILTVHLEGYRKEHFKVQTSEDGTRISIFLEKPVQENVVSGRSTTKTKVFRIPDGVDWKQIKAKFNDLESTLRIDMPKLKKGVVGVRVEEVKEEENRNEIQKSQAENPREIGESEESETVKIIQPNRIEKKREDAKETIKEAKHGEVEDDKSTKPSKQGQEKKEVDKREMGKGKDVGGKPAATEMSNPLRTPLIIVGSTLLVSIVLLAINRIRNRKKR